MYCTRFACEYIQYTNATSYEDFENFTEGVLQQLGEFTVSVRHVSILLGKRRDNISKSRKGLVDVLSLLQPVSSHLGLVHSLASCKINQMHRTMEDSPRCEVSALNMNSDTAAKYIKTIGLEQGMQRSIQERIKGKPNL